MRAPEQQRIAAGESIWGQRRDDEARRRKESKKDPKYSDEGSCTGKPFKLTDA